MADHSTTYAPIRRSMGRRYVIIIVLVIAVYGIMYRRAASHLPWMNDFDAAIAEAGKRNAPILIDFWADWCGPCQALDARIFSANSVEEATKPFVLMRVDLSDESPDTPAAEVAGRYDIRLLPTVLIVDAAHQSVIARATDEDRASPSAFAAFLQRHSGID